MYTLHIIDDSSYSIWTYLKNNWKTRNFVNADKIRYDSNMNKNKVAIMHFLLSLIKRWEFFWSSITILKMLHSSSFCSSSWDQIIRLQCIAIEQGQCIVLGTIQLWNHVGAFFRMQIMRIDVYERRNLVVLTGCHQHKHCWVVRCLHSADSSCLCRLQ
jgi:hypothetical protein